ncbi:MAG: protoheme IX farnesyltransferase [Proteobacteria bacterium]|mgnify:FL=1|nr:protoheme IX farnesyltransferase [Pseudomonadota bacterium]HPO20417.1 heme o synthase [Rubrivivax sp.]
MSRSALRQAPGLATAESAGDGRVDPAAVPSQARSVTWRTVLGVFKLRIGVLIMVSALAGMAIVPAGSASALQVLVLALSVLLASAAAGAFNQFVEADSDRLMARTRQRAFASGLLPRNGAWLLGITALFALAVAAAAWWVNGLAAAFVAAGALTYAVVYTLGLKRRTPWNIVIGGAAGSFAVLAGAAAADPHLGPLAWGLALVLLLWTPPHFWSLAIANEDQYRAAGVPMLPVVVGAQRTARIVHAHAIALVAVSLLLVALGAGWIVLAGALIGGTHFLRKTQALVRRQSRSTAMAAFFASMVQLAVLLLAVVLDAAMR